MWFKRVFIARHKIEPHNSYSINAFLFLFVSALTAVFIDTLFLRYTSTCSARFVSSFHSDLIFMKTTTSNMNFSYCLKVYCMYWSNWHLIIIIMYLYSLFIIIKGPVRVILFGFICLIIHSFNALVLATLDDNSMPVL